MKAIRHRSDAIILTLLLFFWLQKVAKSAYLSFTLQSDPFFNSPPFWIASSIYSVVEGLLIFACVKGYLIGIGGLPLFLLFYLFIYFHPDATDSVNSTEVLVRAIALGVGIWAAVRSLKRRKSAHSMRAGGQEQFSGPGGLNDPQ